MASIDRHLDRPSKITILVTFALFTAALFVKGFGHDLFLEAGVFLVSVKLIIMAYKNSVAMVELESRLAGLQAALARVEGVLESNPETLSSERQPGESL